MAQKEIKDRMGNVVGYEEIPDTTAQGTTKQTITGADTGAGVMDTPSNDAQNTAVANARKTISGAGVMDTPSNDAQNAAVEKARASAIKPSGSLGGAFSSAASNIKSTVSDMNASNPPLEQPLELPKVEPPKPVEAPSAPPVVDTITSDKGTTNRGQVNYDAVLGQATDIKTEEIQQAIKQEAVDRQNIKNAFSHLSAQGRDSGYVNAKNMASIRNAALLRGDAVTAANMKFSNMAMSLAKEKAVSDASFDAEQYRAESETWGNAITGMIESGDIDGAIALAGQLEGEFPQFKPVSNIEFQNYLRKAEDKNLKVRYDEVRQAITDIALNAGEGQALNEDRNRILREVNSDPVFGAGFALEYFGTIPKEDYSIFEIDGDDAEIISQFESGERKWSDPIVQEVFLDAFITGNKEQTRVNEGRTTFGPLYSKYEGDEISKGVLDAVVEGGYGKDGIINFDGNEITVYGDAITLENIETAFVFDAKLKSWDGIPYTEGYSRADAADDPVDGLEEFTNQELDGLHDSYHNNMEILYKKIQDPQERQAFRDNLMNQDSFKENLLQMKKDGMNKSQMTAGINDRTSGGVAMSDTFQNAQGKEVNYEDYGVDIDLFRGNEDAIKTIESIINGDIPATRIMEQLANEGGDPKIFEKMANAGLFLSDPGLDPSMGEGIKITDGVSFASDGNSNMFTGAGMSELLGRLDEDNEAIVFIAGAPHRVKASPSYHDLSGEGTANLPTITWTVTAFGNEDEPQEFKGQITYPDGEYLKARNAAGYAQTVLKNKSLGNNKA